MLYRVEVKVRLKKGVLDPQGTTVEGALRNLGVTGVESVRIGKLVELQVEAASESAAREEAEALARRLLANPVLEDYAVTVLTAGEVAR